VSESSPPSTGGASPAFPAAEQQVRDLQVLLGLTRTMAVTTDLDALLALILESARQLLAAERGTLFLYDAAADELVSKIAHGAPAIRIPARAGIAGACAQDRVLINIPDAYADARFNREVDRQTGYHTRCLLTVPLTGTEGQLVGVLQLLNKVGGAFGRYDEQLAETLAAQIGVTLQRATLLDHFVQKKQLEKSLDIARSIQQGLLPREAPRVPGYEIAGWSQPAEQTGGDCYDFIPLPGGRWGLQIADATGHGIGAALMISTARALLRALSGPEEAPTTVLEGANRWLCADALDGRFVTAFFGILDPTQHRLEYASAGQGPLFWYRADRGEVEATGSTGLPLGVMEDLPIGPAPPVTLGVGDMGVFLTDGFMEAQNAAGAQLGAGELCRLLQTSAGQPAAAVIQVLVAAVREFLAGQPPHDDLTAVVVRRCA
jgi:sigma-B regulation protein RsbU (phosphoserine phosphatase)